MSIACSVFNDERFNDFAVHPLNISYILFTLIVSNDERSNDSTSHPANIQLVSFVRVVSNNERSKDFALHPLNICLHDSGLYCQIISVSGKYGMPSLISRPCILYLLAVPK